jgi:hypothetical protein
MPVADELCGGLGHVRLLAGATRSGQPVYEVLPAEGLDGGIYVLRGSPGLVYGCAGGDRIRVDANGGFDVERRGGNPVPSHLSHRYTDGLGRRTADISVRTAGRDCGDAGQPPVHRDHRAGQRRLPRRRGCGRYVGQRPRLRLAVRQRVRRARPAAPLVDRQLNHAAARRAHLPLVARCASSWCS